MKQKELNIKRYCIGLLLLLVVFLYGCSFDESMPIDISAEMLWLEFKTDCDVAAAKYKGALVSVTGEIAEGPVEFMQDMCILLENGENSIPDGIFCMFPIDSDLSAYHIGQTVTVTGTCNLAIHVAGDDPNPYIFICDPEIK